MAKPPPPTLLVRNSHRDSPPPPPRGNSKTDSCPQMCNFVSTLLMAARVHPAEAAAQPDHSFDICLKCTAATGCGGRKHYITICASAASSSNNALAQRRSLRGRRVVHGRISRSAEFCHTHLFASSSRTILIP